MDINQSADLLETDNPGNLAPFCVPDTFNNDQEIEGFLCRISDHRYGAVVIWKVAGVETKPQVVYCTPKLHYPFGRTEGDDTRVYHPWLKGDHEFAVYEKLDGTNVCAYFYYDAQGKPHLTYKTRLTPVLAANRFLNAAELWRRALTAVQAEFGVDIPGLIWQNWAGRSLYSYSFELYGYENPLSIVYRVPITTRLLCCVRQQDHVVQLPDSFGIPTATTLGRHTGPFTSFYENLRQAISNETVVREDGRIARSRGTNDALEDGLEGYVFYVRDPTAVPAVPCCDGPWAQMKCKSQQMETAHWATGAIPSDVVFATAWNALESCDDLTPDYVRELLLEEFSVEQVALSGVRIATAVQEVLAKFALKWRVLEALRVTAMESGGSRGDVMRALSRHFEKKEIKLVFWIVNDMRLFR